MKYSPNKIKNFFRKQKRMPSYSEISSLYGFKSKNASYGLVKKFIENNFLEKDSCGKLIPGKNFSSLSILGSVQAGFPTYETERNGEYMTLDQWLVNDSDATYILEVSGDSMIDAGILEGDYVIVERTQNYSLGDIVVAELDGEWTLKYLRKKNKSFYLEAANKKYPDLFPEEDLKIHAVVRSVVRKYESKKS